MALKTRTRPLKDGTLKFLTGNRTATREEIKQFVKKNYAVIPVDKVDAKTRQYIGQVKGGKARSATAAQDKSGKFYSEKYLQKYADDILKNKFIDLNKIKEKKDYKKLGELFKKEPAAVQALKELESESGLPFWYKQPETRDKIKTFNGDIFIDGKKYAASTALRKLSEFKSRMRRDNITFSLKFYYVGMSELHFSLDEDSDDVFTIESP